MKSSRKRRVIALALAGVAFLGATSVTIMGTMALFSDTKKANNHINAGSLKLGFELTNLKGKMPNASTGILEDVDDSTVVDLTADGAKIFDIDNAVPGLDLTATLRLTNNGSVAFSSVTSIVDLELGKDAQQIVTTQSTALAAALDVEIYYIDSTSAKQAISFKLKDYASHSLTLPNIINSGDQQIFYAHISLASTVGNEVQTGSADFDINVTATQIQTL